jgi:hypothetical protein
MTKLIAVITAGLFAAGTILAADPDKCAQHVAACKALVDTFKYRGEGNKDLFKRYLDIYQKNGCSAAAYIGINSYALAALKASAEPKQYETFQAGCRDISAE